MPRRCPSTSTSDGTDRVSIVRLAARGSAVVDCRRRKRRSASRARPERATTATTTSTETTSIRPAGRLYFVAGFVATSAIGTGSVRGTASDGNSNRALPLRSAASSPDGLDPKRSIRPPNHRRLPDSRSAAAAVSGPASCDSRRAGRDACMVWCLIEWSERRAMKLRTFQGRARPSATEITAFGGPPSQG